MMTKLRGKESTRDSGGSLPAKVIHCNFVTLIDVAGVTQILRFKGWPASLPPFIYFGD